MGKESKMINSVYRWLIVLAGIITAMLAFAIETRAQSTDALLYGKVYTEKTIYTGVIRWGTEEALWTDLFNASKVTNQYKRMVPEQKEEEDSWLNIDWSFGSIWEDKIVPHQFNCQFGNLSQITRLNDNRARLKFKNGKEMEVSGEGYNDLGSDIQVADAELGRVSIDWGRITKVEFLQAPAKVEAVFGAPLYGTVEGIRREKFTGYIAWDNDERLVTDRLDGDADDNDVSLKFSDITSIEKQGRGSLVKLKSGRALFLTGSNDVNAENRGVLVSVPGLGVVKVSWNAFRKITFSEADASTQPYHAFPAPSFLQGKVSTLEGDDAAGRIIFDIDEVLDFELVEGRENDIEYSIPLRNIKKITPKNFDYSSIELRNGQTLLLGGGQDVSSRNGGVLVFQKGKKEGHYVNWKKINEIIFN